MAHLLQISGPAAGYIHPLTSASCVIGRSEVCDLVVWDDSVSRQHAKIRLRGKHYTIRDLGSSNGTKLNGERLTQRERLENGDRLQLCQSEFQFFETLSPLPDSPTDVDHTSHQMFKVDMSGPERAPIKDSVQFALPQESPDENQTMRQRVEALLKVSQRLGESLSLDDLMPQLLDDLFTLIPHAERATVVLCLEDDQFLVRWWKLMTLKDEDVKVSRTIIRHVLKTREAVTSNDVLVDARFADSQTLEVMQIRSVMCAPLCDSQGEILGVLQVDSQASEKEFHKDELLMLSSVATQMATALHVGRMHQQSVHERMLRRDLELAAEVQRSLLPDAPPDVAGYTFFDYYEPAEHIGGDFFDYIPLPRGRAAVIVADVSGHDVAAALRMARFSADARYLMAMSNSLTEVVAQLNTAACSARAHDGEFITCLVLLLDPAKKHISMVLAGHESPLLRRKDGEVAELSQEEFGPALGILDEPTFHRSRIVLKPGEVLMLYTDGATDVKDASGDRFGKQRLMDQLASPVKEATPKDAGQNVVDGLDKFMGRTTQPDDICLVCIGREP